MIRLRGFVLVAILTFTVSDAAAQTFTVLSLNTLHLGWGKKKSYTDVKQLLTLQKADVIVLQEVMPKYYETLKVSSAVDIKPATYSAVPMSPPRGRGSYLEQYQILVSTKFKFSNPTEYAGTGATTNFIRPPYGVIVQTGTTWTWVIDYHAIFGKSISQRQAEVTRMADVAKWYAGLSTNSNGSAKRIVLCGDWNLPTDDAAYKPLKLAVMTAAPNVATSLTPVGLPSSAYDHCVWSKDLNTSVATAVVIANPIKITPQDYRNSISDHLPISATLPYK